MVDKTTLSNLILALERHDIRYALLGGFAMGLWDGSGITVNLDFVVNHDDMLKIDEIMHSLGYSCNYKGENVSHFVPSPNDLGDVIFFRRIEGDISVNLPELKRKYEHL